MGVHSPPESHRQRLLPHLCSGITVLLVLSLVLPLQAQEQSVSAPMQSPAPALPGTDAAPPVPATPTTPSTAPTDPCADLREQVRQLQATAKKKKPRKKVRKSLSHKKPGAKGKKKRRAGVHSTGIQKATTASAATKTANGANTCSGAMNMKEVREILGTTRDLSGRNLNCLDFTGFDLKKVNFSGATMIRTNCSRANMEDSNLERANLTDANLTRANLHLSRLAGTTFTNARIDNALWTDRRLCAPGSLGDCRDTFQP